MVKYVALKKSEVLCAFTEIKLIWGLCRISHASSISVTGTRGFRATERKSMPVPQIILRGWLCQNCGMATARDQVIEFSRAMQMYGVDHAIELMKLSNTVLCENCAADKRMIDEIFEESKNGTKD